MTPFRILFLCTHNSARSILAEAAANAVSPGRIEAHSAGSAPRGAVRTEALTAIARAGLPTTGLSSKSWDVFAGEGAPAFDLVITVCDAAANEPCPYFPGAPVTVNWGVPDPSDAPENARQAAFEATFDRLHTRIVRLAALPLERLRGAALRAAVRRIAEEDPD